MTQIAQVNKILANDLAELSVHRKTACSKDCSKCTGGCELTITNLDLKITAENRLGAHQGDVVLVESANNELLGAAVVVYLVPFALFFIGYVISQLLSFRQGASIIFSFICFLLGLLPARWLDRRVKENDSLRFHIIEILK